MKQRTRLIFTAIGGILLGIGISPVVNPQKAKYTERLVKITDLNINVFLDRTNLLDHYFFNFEDLDKYKKRITIDWPVTNLYIVTNNWYTNIIDHWPKSNFMYNTN